MSAVHPLSARQQLVVALGALLVVAVVIISLFVQVPLASAIVLGGLALVAVTMLALRARAAVRPARRAAPAAVGASYAEALPTLQLTFPDGEVLAAREVPLPQPGEHQLLLTRRGYVIVNAAGQVIYQL